MELAQLLGHDRAYSLIILFYMADPKQVVILSLSLSVS